MAAGATLQLGYDAAGATKMAAGATLQLGCDAAGATLQFGYDAAGATLRGCDSIASFITRA